MKRNRFKLCMAMCTVATMVMAGGVPDQISYAAEDTVTITVAAYDYTAGAAGLEGASKTGVVMEQEVTVPADTTAADAVKRAFDEAGVTVSGLDYGYVTSIGDLGAGEGYSGWCMAYDNDDYSNYGLSSITLSDGDTIRFDYSCNVDTTTDDIGNGWYGNPIVKSLSVGENELTMSVSTVYDDNFNPTYTYYINGTKTEASGTADDPFIFDVELPVNEASLSPLKMTTNLNSHYAVVDGDWTVSDETYEMTADLSEGCQFSISSLGGRYKSYFKIVTECTENSLSDTYGDKLNKVVEYLRGKTEAPAYGGEWNVMTLARYGYKNSEWYRVYYDSVVSTVKEKGSAKLDANKSTENSRVILALTSIGADVTSIGGYNLLEPLGDITYVKKQGLNGAVYTLMAFDCGDYEIPVIDGLSEETQTTRKALVDTILEAKLKAGGWTFFGSAADPDMTAMAVCALAPYYTSDERVKAAIDEAVNVLSLMQKDTGCMASYGTENAESCAQVICALSAIEIDSEENEAFVKKLNSLLDGMLAFYDEQTGGFAHVTGSNGSITTNAMASVQAGYALVSYDRYKNSRNSLYDMTDSERLFTPDKADISIDKLTSNNGVVKLTWNKVEGAHIYDIYRLASGEKSYTRIATTTGTGYTDKAVTKGKKYAYMIKTDSGNVAGSSSASKIAVLADTRAEVQNAASGIAVNWNKVPGATGYTVYRMDSTAKTWRKLSVTTKNSYTDKTVKKNLKYRYAIKATASGAVGGYVSAATYRIAPESIKAITSPSKKSIKVQCNRDTFATGYQVMYSLNSNFSSSKKITVRDNRLTTTSFRVYRSGSRYYVRVRAYKKVGATVYYGSWSPAKSVIAK